MSDNDLRRADEERDRQLDNAMFREDQKEAAKVTLDSPAPRWVKDRWTSHIWHYSGRVVSITTHWNALNQYAVLRFGSPQPEMIFEKTTEWRPDDLPLGEKWEPNMEPIKAKAMAAAVEHLRKIADDLGYDIVKKGQANG